MKASRLSLMYTPLYSLDNYEVLQINIISVWMSIKRGDTIIMDTRVVKEYAWFEGSIAEHTQGHHKQSVLNLTIKRAPRKM